MAIYSVLQTGLLNQSSAQVIDGSLNFEGGKNQALKRTPTSRGNRRTWTWSCWLKKQNANRSTFFSAGTTSSDTGFSEIAIGTQKRLRFSGWNTNWKTGSERLRDYNSFYHFVIAVDYTNSTASNKVRLYKNGVEVTDLNSNNTPSDAERAINDTVIHYIGGIDGGGGENLSFTDYQMSQVYFIDGQQLGPENFGFTDPLTNTWRPRKAKIPGFNDGTVWSSNSTNFTNPGQAFNGNPTNAYAEVSSSAAKGTFTFPKSIQVENNVTFIYSSATSGNLFVNDSSTAMQGTSLQIQTISFSGTLTNISLQSSSQPVLYYFSVDGKPLIDSVTNNFGNNGFYLPMDGNSPIGQDKSGNGNDWTPVNFGGSAGVDKATGALPILEGAGGAVANVGVRTDAYAQGDPNNQLSRNYSSNTTATGGFSGSYPKTNLFDGAAPADGNRAEAASNDDPINITFDPPITVSSTISLWSGKSSTRYQINDSGTYTTYSDAVGSYKDISHSGSLSNIKILHGSAGQAAGISAIKIDGTQLIDSGLTLALPLVGSANDVSNRINSGSTAKTVSVNGDPASSTLQSNFYGASFYFDGSANTDYVSVADNDQLDVGSGDFTIECWAYVSGYPNNNPGLLSKRGGNGAAHWQLVLNRNGQIQFGDQATWSNYFGTSSGTTGDTIFKDNWHHIAITRTSGSVQAWYDGRKYGTAITNTTDFSTSANFSVGVGRENNYDPFQGYVNDVRVYKGVAKYTENFIPASTNPDILPDTPSGVSGGSKLTKITDGAVTFDGTGDYLNTAWSSDFAFGTGDFTIEMFVYWQGDTSTSTVLAWGEDIDNRFDIGCQTANQIRVFARTGGSTFVNMDVANGISTNKWIHLAVVRNSSAQTMKLYIDGVEKASTSSVTATMPTNTSNGIDIGRRRYASSTSDDYQGFISNLRIIKGTALYTSDFIPPTKKLTNVTNTKLLCCQSNTSATAVAAAPNLSAINDGTHWSGATLTNGSNLAGLFDESLSTNAQQSTNGTAASVTNFGPVNVSSTVSFYSPDGDARYTLNGGSEVSVSGTGWHDISFSGTLTSFTFQAPGNARIFIYGMKIDGTQLVDIITPNGDAAATTFNPFNTDINTVRGQETSYATWNPLTNRGVVTTSDGNLTANAINSGYGYTLSTIPVSSGKYYCEISFEGTMAHSVNYNYIGIVPTDSAAIYTGQDIFRADGALSIDSNGSVIRGNIGTGSNDTNNTYQSSYGFDENDTIGIAIDCDTPQVTFYKNGTSIGTFPHTMQSNKSWYLFVNDWANAADFTGYILNAGQKPFKFSPPDGFQSINAANVRPETVIVRPDRYVGIVTYSGAGGTQSVTGYNFNAKPDFVWIKNRSDSGGASHILFDTVRGAGKSLNSNETSLERTNHNYGYLTSFDFNGYTVTGGSSGDGETNDASNTYVAWAWKAGGNKNTFNVNDVGYANASDVNMSVGSLNSSFYNTSETWSNGLSALSGSSLTNPPNGFNGDPDSYADSTNGWSLDLSGHTFGTGAHTIEVKSGGATSFSVGGTTGSGSLTDPGGGGAKVWTGTYTGEINSITSSASGASVYYVKIDGKILVNSGTDLSGRTQYPSIAPSGCSVGTKQGFSIIEYSITGSGGYDSIPHGLLRAPEFGIFKSTSNSTQWGVYYTANGQNTNWMRLNTTDEQGNNEASGGIAGNAYVRYTDSVVEIDHSAFAAEGTAGIGYIWHSVPGLQKFGTYEGTGVAGNYVHLGFRPALIWIKNIDNTSINNWGIIDSTRSYANPGNHTLATNLNNPESYFGDGSSVYGSSNKIDLVSDGFVLRETSGFGNTSGITFLYCAWAETPALNLFGAQSNAR